MKTLEKIQRGCAAATGSLASLLKVALMSRRPSAKGESKDGSTLVIMGNGPSLREAMEKDADVLAANELMSVNFAPLTPEFFQFRPAYHVLADDVFFASPQQGNVAEMWKALQRVDWEMTLFMPVKHRRNPDLRYLPPNVKFKFFNLTPVGGWKWLSRMLYNTGLGMPRPRNVLVPSIMMGIREGYKKIILIGADHSWSKTLWVTDNNVVVSVQPHFYKDNEKERERVESLYKNIRLHQIYESFAIAFRSYFAVKDYARSRGVEILNATPGSFIDAFARTQLSTLRK